MVSALYSLTMYIEAVPYMQELPEFKAVEDEEGRKAAFAKFVKRQKAGLTQRADCKFSYSLLLRPFTGTPTRARA